MALVKDLTLRAKKMYRQTFEMKKEGVGSILIHTLLVNPEDMQMEEPARANVTQTLGGAYVMDFGQGLFTVTLSGITGYRKRVNTEGKLMDGFEEFITFRNKIYRDFIAKNDPKLSLYWYNWEDGEFYQIQPLSFRLMRNKSEPLLYRYEFRFVCIKKLVNVKLRPSDSLSDPNPTVVWGAIMNRTSMISEFLNNVVSRVTQGIINR